MFRRLADARQLAVGLAIVLSTAACTSADNSATTDDNVLAVFGPWRGSSADHFRTALEPFEKATGIDVRYTGTGSFADLVLERAEDGDSPDVAMFPQPGLVKDMAHRGFVLPLREDVAALAESNYLPIVAESIADVGADVPGVLYQMNVKSLVWYPPNVFEQHGYDIPASWDEMDDLGGRMVDDGFAPWCLGVEAFAASGWPATDWVEDIILRFAGADVYDSWVVGDIRFTDPAIADAFMTFNNTALQPHHTIGGRRGILNTHTASAQNPMFEDPPRCLMHRQASFQVESLPKGTRIGADGDVDVFVLPPFDPSTEAPLLFGGTVAAAMTDRDETWQLMRYLASPESGAAWAQAGGFISPHKNFDSDQYGTEFDARLDDLLNTASLARFDGSDLMYPPVGTRTFFDAMVLYIGTERLSDSLDLAQSGYDD